jgi:hypothetical protein
MNNFDALLVHQATFENYLNPQRYQLSPYHFSSIFLWQNFFEFEFDVVEESLCVFAHQPGASFLYLPPLASGIKPTVVDYCFTKMNKINPRIARIENIQQDQLKFFNDRFKVNFKAQEYVYHKQDLIDLKGHAYKSQRHDIHHFQLHHEALFRPFEDKDAKACLELYERWAKNRHDKHEDDVYRQMLEENRIVHELALLYHQPLGLKGYVVEIDKQIEAYSFGYSLNSEIFCVLLEITNTNYYGLNAFIFNRVCSADAASQHTRINTMDDFGLPYVAASKQAYHPNQKPVSSTITAL